LEITIPVFETFESQELPNFFDALRFVAGGKYTLGNDN
jgi:hypothetical protein